MSILSFVTQEEIDDLDDDPRVAFMELANHAQRKFDALASAFDPSDEFEFKQLDDLRYNFMNVIIAAAKRFEIEPFISKEVPEFVEFREHHHRQFRANLDHYITQMVLDNSLRNKQDSVKILPKTKDNIRSYVLSMRQCIEDSSMSDAKREALLKKLDEFEDELERRRLSLMAVTRVAFALWAVPGATWASVDVANKLINNIMQTVAEAKATEQETKQLAPIAPPKALSPPRSETSPRVERPRGADYNFDDDIPF